MSMSTSRAHGFVAASPSPAPGLSETEPPDEWKRQIKERINTNLQKLYQDAEELYKRRLQKVRSDDERGRLKEDHKLEMDRILALGAEEYHAQLELERQQRRWALGQPIDAKWKDALMREHRKISESYKPAEPSPSRKGAQSSRSSEHAHVEGTAALPIWNEQYDPPSPVEHEYEIWRAQSSDEHAHEEEYENEIWRAKNWRSNEHADAEVTAGPIRNEQYNPSSLIDHGYEISRADITAAEGAGTRRGLARQGSTAHQRSIGSNNIYSLPTEPIVEWPHSSERGNILGRDNGEQVAPPPVPQRWNYEIFAEEVAGPGRGLAGRGSTASQRSGASNSIRPLTIKEPDGHKRDNVPRQNDGEPVASSPDKGKERQHQSRTFQLTTNPTERWGKPSAPGMGNPKLPNFAPPVRPLADRSPGPYYRPLDISAEEEAAGTERALSMRGSTASQPSVGYNSIRSLTTEPIFEWPDGSEHVNVPRKDDGESVTSSPDKGKNRQRQRGTFQSTTRPNGRWEEPSAPGMSNPKLPNSAPPVRSLADRSPGLYYRPQRWSRNISAEEELAGPGRGNTTAFLLTTERHRRRELLVPWSSSPPLGESFHEILELLLVTLMEICAVRGPLVNDRTLVLFRKLLNIPDATIVSGVETADQDVQLFFDFLLHVLRQDSLQAENFAQDVKRKARKLMIRLVSKTNVLPRHLFITDLEIEPQAIAVGGFGKVFKGKCGGQPVALKMLYQSRRPGDSIEKDLYAEAFAWWSLSNRFILPLLGIYEEGPQLYLVSPFMINGPLRDWRKGHIPVRVDEIQRLLLEVAEGIQYIHSEGIVHGDLHGANVLLDSEFHCQITDFGSTRPCDVTVTQSTTTLSFNFAAPELIGMCATCGELDCDEPHHDGNEQHKIKTMKTDVYAFGCLYYAIFFDTVPFHGKSNFQIIRLVTRGARPERIDNPVMEEHIWNVVQRCWKSIPSERPTMEEVMATLTLAA